MSRNWRITEMTVHEDFVIEPKTTVDTIQRYGYFYCKNCQRQWGSPFVFIFKGPPMRMYRQGCKLCQTFIGPYQTKDCRYGHKPGDTPEDKKHCRNLCEKCYMGWLCNPNKDEIKLMFRKRKKNKY